MHYFFTMVLTLIKHRVYLRLTEIDPIGIKSLTLLKFQKYFKTICGTTHLECDLIQETTNRSNFILWRGGGRVGVVAKLQNRSFFPELPSKLIKRWTNLKCRSPKYSNWWTIIHRIAKHHGNREISILKQNTTIFS